MKISDRKFWTQMESDPEVAAAVIMEFQSYFPESFPTEEAVRAYAKRQLTYGHMCTAYRYGEPLGFISGYANDTTDKVAYVTLVAVKPNLGLMKGYVLIKLLDIATQYGLDKGMEMARLEVRDSNTHAMELYRKLGFKEVGRASDHSVYMEMPIVECRKAMGAKTKTAKE